MFVLLSCRSLTHQYQHNLSLFFSELVGRCVGEGSFQPGICNRMHCLVPEAVMEEFGAVAGI